MFSQKLIPLRQLRYSGCAFRTAFRYIYSFSFKFVKNSARGTSTEKIYQELGLESFKSRRWFRKFCHFYKIFSEKSPSYLFNLIPNFNRVHSTRLSHNIPPIKVRHHYFKSSFFPSAITGLNKLDLNIRNSASLNTFKKKLLNFIRPCANSIFDIHNPLGIKFSTRRLRLDLSHLHEHKFRYCFQDTLNPLCECGKNIESTMHFFLHCTRNEKAFLDKTSFRKLEKLMTAFYLKVKRN